MKKLRLSGKDPAIMRPGEINKELERLRCLSSEYTTWCCANGRGDWYLADTQAAANQGDQRSIDALLVSERFMDLIAEIGRYGPGAPSYCPKGFGPRKQKDD